MSILDYEYLKDLADMYKSVADEFRAKRDNAKDPVSEKIAGDVVIRYDQKSRFYYDKYDRAIIETKIKQED